MYFAVTPLSSLCLAVFFAFLFVSSLYVWRRSTLHDRDDPAVIKQRLFSVLSVCLIAPITLIHFTDTSHRSPTLLTLLGLAANQNFLTSLLLPLAHTASLFLGPLFLIALSNPSPKRFVANIVDYCQSITSTERSKLIALRNLIVAPLCEEFIFRSCIISLIVAGHYNFTVSLLVSPALFGLAHLHHLIGLIRAKGYSVKQGVIAVTFQLTHTVLFGVYASYVFLVTGSLYSVIACHAFCNLMEFPDLQWIGNPYHPHHSRRLPVMAVFLFGIALFVMLWPECLSEDLYDSYFIEALKRNELIGSGSGSGKSLLTAGLTAASAWSAAASGSESELLKTAAPLE